MTEGTALPAPLPRRPPGRLGTYAPWPLVGVAALLVILIVVTPLLVANTHQPSPGILTQAELVVDKTVTNATLHFYVWALGETIRYHSIQIGVAAPSNWTGNTTLDFARLNWTRWYNGSDVLSVIVAAAANPVALNITVLYQTSGGTAWYVGLLAFYVVEVTANPLSESLISQSGTPGVTVASPLAVTNTTLPFDILLRNAGSGATP